MMNENDFFDKICCKHSTLQERIVALLFARGYLIRCYDNRFYAFPNVDNHELGELNKRMVQLELGRVEGRQLIISEEASLDQAKLLFSQQQIREAECWPRTCSWTELFNYHPHDLPETEKLEPFIALYVKAINLCGVRTIGSCDGNHTGKRCAFLQFYGEPFRFWHSFIRDRFLQYASNSERQSNWNSKTDKLFFSERTKYENYYCLYKDACFFLQNYRLILATKDEIFSKLSSDELNSNDNDLMHLAFQEYLSKGIEQSRLSKPIEWI